LGSCPADKCYDLGKDWITALCGSLLPFVPPELMLPLTEEEVTNGLTSKLRYPSSPDKTQNDGNVEIPPLDAPCHPVLFKGLSFGEYLIENFRHNLSDQDTKLEAVKTSIGIRSGLQELKEELDAFADVLSRAGKQKNNWEDMRSDILIRILMKTPFMKDPIQGDPVCGHDLKVRLGDMEAFDGEIFERPIGLSEDALICEKLRIDARASTQAMREIIYPNREMCPAVERIRTKGSIDPARLALSDFSQAVFKVNRLQERLDRRGSPVVAIACDGSGSLAASQMQMLKVLATSWINSTAGTDIRVLAGLYTSDQIREGVSGPVVKWIYHPHKTPATSRNDAARAVAALPESGTGVQSDALSIAFITEEAKKLAKGKMIYLILLTDCAWNKSFRSERSGYDEVRSLFETLYVDLQEQLHVTMVGLGVSERTGMEDLLDKVIAISAAELNDSKAIAGKIGLYVASCVRERNNR
jgi:hypothetical protein